MDLDKMIAKFDRQATKAAYDYQETGTTRYNTARRNAEEMASALRIAKNAKRDYSELCELRSYISGWCVNIDRMRFMEGLDRERALHSLLDGIRTVGNLHGLTMEP